MPRNNLSSLLNYIKLLIGISIISLFWGVITRLLRPFWHAYQIDNWLNSEPDYIQDYSRTIRKTGHFEFELELSGEDSSEIIIENVRWGAPIRIEASKKLDPGLMMNLVDEENEFHVRRRRDLQSAIEAILSTTPGIFNYRDVNGESVTFEQADSVSLEYRIYPDGLTQHELINGIVSIANALLYVDQREQSLKEEIKDGM